MSQPVRPEEVAHAASLVKRHLGFDTLREGQAETLVRVLRGENVLAILPTGGGKSLCYQLPGTLTPGVTLVVSPLIALMKDQLDSMMRGDAPSGRLMRAFSVSLTSELDASEMRRVVDEIGEGRYRLVYLAPERLRQAGLLRALRKSGVVRLVVDEAHCVSMWGHDFRPDYLALADVRRALGDPPVLAMTATAPPRVEADIQQRLGAMTVVRTSIDRPNLRFETIVCRDADDKLAHLYSLCRDTPGPGVVYAGSRAKCEQLAAALQSAGLNAEAYHAGLPDRAQRQDAFLRGDVDILVATVAFGMGVDKQDIRFVFHHDPSSSLENYYQEAGRAGRDGAPARCVMLATAQDGGSLKTRAKSDLPSRDLISHVWASVMARHEGDLALVPVEDLDDLKQDSDDVKPRVALSILVEAGVVERLGEVPLRVRTRGGSLPPEGSVLELAGPLGVPPELVEGALLDVEAKGSVQFLTSGRAHLLRVHGDTSHVEDVLERYQRTAAERAEEVMAYVKARRCRVQLLRIHFGEPEAQPCGHCDVCLGLTHEAVEIPGADEDSAARAVLQALSGVRGMGQLNLVYTLRGDARAPDWVLGKPGFGALAFRSEAKVRAAIDAVERQGLIQREQLPHGGFSLQLTQRGAGVIEGIIPLEAAPQASPAPPGTPGAMASAAAPRRTTERTRVAGDDEVALDDAGDALFERLRVWRRERADAEMVPPYVVAADKTLRAIAAARPTTERALLDVKGMGPKKVEKYGADILGIVGGGA